MYTAAEQDLGIPYLPIVREYARSLYGSLINISKYGIFSGEPPQGKNEVQYDQSIFEVGDSQKTYGKALVREAIIHSHKGKATHTICYLGHNASVSDMLNKLNTIYAVVVSYDVLTWKFYQVAQEQGESVSDYLICIEGVLNDIKNKFLTWVTEIESDQLLQSRFYSGLCSWIWDGMRDIFRNSAYDVTALMKAAQDLED